MAQAGPADAPEPVAPAENGALDNFFRRRRGSETASCDPRQRAAERIGIAERVLRFRRLRREILNPGYFGEAAFNMLLDLYICRVRGRTVYQNDAYIASMVPATTAYRWLLVLERDGLVRLRGDLQDRRRGVVLLTAMGVERVEALLDAWAGLRTLASRDPLCV